MNKVGLLAGILLLAGTTSAQVGGERTAKEIIAVLNSKEVSSLIKMADQKDGQLRGIHYVSSGRAAWGPAFYEVSFNSYTTEVPEVCTVTAAVDVQTSEVMSVGEMTCE